MASRDTHSAFDLSRKYLNLKLDICMDVAMSPIIPSERPSENRTVTALRGQHNRLAAELMSSNDPCERLYHSIRTNFYSVCIRCHPNVPLYRNGPMTFQSIPDTTHTIVHVSLSLAVFGRRLSYLDPMPNIGISDCSYSTGTWMRKKQKMWKTMHNLIRNDGLMWPNSNSK